MLQYTDSGTRPRLVLLLRHDDAEREYAYDRDSRIGRLDKALDEAVKRKWTVVSMKKEWKTVPQLARASVADNTCRGITGQPAMLTAARRSALDAAGGFAPAQLLPPGPIPPAIGP